MEPHINVNWQVGYKGFTHDLKSKYRNIDFQYKEGEIFTLESNKKLKLCESGFHFCKNLLDVFLFYELEINPGFRYYEIAYDGDNCLFEENCNMVQKGVTRKIKLVRELNDNDIFQLTNGKIQVWRSDVGHQGRSLLHRDGNLPAYIGKFIDSDQINEQYYYIHGKLHRDGDNPSIIEYDNVGNEIRIEYYKEGFIHRDNNLCAVNNKYPNSEWYRRYIMMIITELLKMKWREK
jgi:hypothetical protein